MRMKYFGVEALRIALCLASSLLVALSFEPYGAWPCALVAWAPLLFAVKGQSARQAFSLGFLQGMAAYGFSLYWFFTIFGWLAMALYAIISLFSGLFCMGVAVSDRKIRCPFLNVLFVALWWTGIEFFRSELFFLRFSWITPGTAMGPVWLSPLVGVYGVSFCVMLIPAALRWKKTWPLGIAAAAVMALLGIFRPPAVAPSEQALTVAAIQSDSSHAARAMALTESTADRKPRLVVWPEYAIVQELRKQQPRTLADLQALCGKMACVCVLGTRTGAQDAVHGHAGKAGWYNTALTVDGSGILGEYYKTRPVHFFNDGIPGKKYNVIKTPLGMLGTPICFDYDYSAVSRRMALNGAALFAIPSYDAKHWTMTQHRQHAALLPLRAAENGRWMVCAASSGISCIVDPHGRIHQSLETMDEGVIVGRVEAITTLTFFTRLGWLFPWVCLVVSILWFFALLLWMPRKL